MTNGTKSHINVVAELQNTYVFSLAKFKSGKLALPAVVIAAHILLIFVRLLWGAGKIMKGISIEGLEEKVKMVLVVSKKVQFFYS